MKRIGRAVMLASLPLFVQAQAPAHVDFSYASVVWPTGHLSAIKQKTPALFKAIKAGGYDDATPVSLGTLGMGALVADSGPGACGATGNCVTEVYFYYHGRYVSSFLDSGSAVGLLPAKDVPGLVVVNNMGAGSEAAVLYKFESGKWIEAGCEMVDTMTQDGDLINDPAKMPVHPCN